MDEALAEQGRAARRRACGLLAALAMLGSGGAAWAQGAGIDAWQVEVTPYLWATRMRGEVQVGTLPAARVAMDFSDILHNLDFGFMTAVEARRGLWGVLLDGMYMKVSDSVTAAPAGIPVSVTGQMRIRQTMLAAALAYRVAEGPMLWDLVAGLRHNVVDAQVGIDANASGLAGSAQRSGKTRWTDPYAGVRATLPIDKRWSAVGSADVGGFGVGSDFTWQALAGFKYDASEKTTLHFGYRAMKVDYDQAGLRYDMANDGLYAGMGVRF